MDSDHSPSTALRLGRRRLLGLGAGLVGAAACERLTKTGPHAAVVGGEAPLDPARVAAPAPAVHTGARVQWRVVTTWPKSLPVLGQGVQMLADQVATMSGGRFTLEVFGAGELVGAFEVFDAVSRGIAELGHGAAYYWSGKVPAAQFFTSVPFGMNALQMYGWLLSGGGLALWEETYSDFDLLPIPAGNTGMQMGGWFRKRIQTLADFQGLKMRIPGFGGRVFARIGGAPELLPGGEIYTSLERGVIDATEWVGPYHDYLMGFHRVAKYYYYPGWHEPTGILELLVNRSAWSKLPREFQEILRQAALAQNTWMLAEMEAKNAVYLDKLIAAGVEVLPFPDDVLAALRQATIEELDAFTATDPQARKIRTHYEAHLRRAVAWSRIADQDYYNRVMAQS